MTRSISIQPELDSNANILIGVVDQLVEILPPSICILVIEVAAHGQHDVVLREHIIGVASRPFRNSSNAS